MDFDFEAIKADHTSDLWCGHEIVRRGSQSTLSFRFGEGQRTTPFCTLASRLVRLPSCWPLDEILVAYYAVEGNGSFGSHRNSHVLDGFTRRPPSTEARRLAMGKSHQEPAL